VQPGVWNIGLELHASGGQHRHQRRDLNRVREQFGLPDAGFALDEQRLAATEPRLRQRSIDRCQLQGAAEQHQARMSRLSAGERLGGCPDAMPAMRA
jgi:hypothetical protein